jgi:lysophospholipase L1-like esterase
MIASKPKPHLRSGITRPLKRIYRGAAVVLFTTLLVLMGIELVAAGIWNVWGRVAPVAPIAPDASELPHYAATDWGTPFWEEFSRVQKQRYTPYIVWWQIPFAGEYINIDEQGIRRTPGADCQPESYRVFVFGGSTIWGVGAPDDMTIPAYIQAELDTRHDGSVCVVNFGELGYVSTQEVIRLSLELREGNIPDMAVFYDGLNEVYAAYQNGKAGEHQNLEYIAGRYELRPQAPPLLELWWHSNTFKVLQQVRQPAPPAQGYGRAGVTLDSLSQDILQTYTGNRRLVAALAQTYEFEYAFFWQPDLTVSQKELDMEEQQIINALSQPLIDLYRAVYEQAARINEAHFYNIADALDDRTGLLWIDSFHIIPEGNAIIANKIMDAITGTNQ